jgi:hypothetical protein
LKEKGKVCVPFSKGSEPNNFFLHQRERERDGENVTDLLFFFLYLEIPGESGPA